MGIKTSFTRYATKFSQATTKARQLSTQVSLTNRQGHVTRAGSYHPLLIGDFSTRELFNERLAWQEDRPMTAQLVRHVMPCAKFIVMMRNPTERLFSDYVYFMKKTPAAISAQHFHRRVTESIDWWNQCRARFPLQKCLFGSPPELPPVFTGRNAECWQSDVVCPYIRIGLYYHILVEWLKVFPRESFLFIRTEDYKENELEILNNIVFPFLAIPAFSEDESQLVSNMERQFPSKHGDFKEALKGVEMLPKTRAIIQEFYREPNEKLAELLNDDRYQW